MDDIRIQPIEHITRQAKDEYWDFSTLYTSLPHANSLNCWRDSSTPEEITSSPPTIFMLSGRMIGSTFTSPVGNFDSLLTFLWTTSTSTSESSFSGKLHVFVCRWALTVHPC